MIFLKIRACILLKNHLLTLNVSTNEVLIYDVDEVNLLLNEILSILKPQIYPSGPRHSTPRSSPIRASPPVASSRPIATPRAVRVSHLCLFVGFRILNYILFDFKKYYLTDKTNI